MITAAQRAEFQKLAEPMMLFLQREFHPHVTAVIENTTAQLMEGLVGHVIDLKDPS